MPAAIIARNQVRAGLSSMSRACDGAVALVVKRLEDASATAIASMR